MATRARNRFIVGLCAIGALSAADVSSTAATEQLTLTTTTSQTSSTTTIYYPIYAATLEASFDWGDLGWDWQKTLGIEGTETPVPESIRRFCRIKSMASERLIPFSWPIPRANRASARCVWRGLLLRSIDLIPANSKRLVSKFYVYQHKILSLQGAFLPSSD